MTKIHKNQSSSQLNTFVTAMGAQKSEPLIDACKRDWRGEGKIANPILREKIIKYKFLSLGTQFRS